MVHIANHSVYVCTNSVANYNYSAIRYDRIERPIAFVERNDLAIAVTIQILINGMYGIQINSASLQVTPSELDETWFVSSTCGFMKPGKFILSYVVWLLDYS